MTAKRLIIAIVLVFSLGILTSSPVRAQFVDEKYSSVTSQDQIDDILADLSNEELEAMVQAAIRRRLEVERLQTAAEISQNILYEPERIEKALTLLENVEKSSQSDNISRICKAYAITDARFAEPYELYTKGNYQAAAALLKPMLNPEEETYLSAAMHYVYGVSLIKTDKIWKGTEALTEILVNLPDRISFASEAAFQAAAAYEKMGRKIYAMQMYSYAMQNYSLTMDKKLLDETTTKLAKYETIYKNPMKTITEMLGEIKGRLDKDDTGKKTQLKQQETLDVLDDWIKTLEEKNRQKDNQNQKNQQREKRKQERKKTEEEKKSAGKKQGNPSGSKRSKTGARASVLVPGPVSTPNNMAKKFGAGSSDKWSEMPAKQRELIENLMRQRTAQRRSGLVSDYHKKIAEGE
ncbi:MAG: hypothetical protein KAR11_02060 [Phycisphaerae bacterium]|nr:hypothetical protein [Phycisphaerae bacterium]